MRILLSFLLLLPAVAQAHPSLLPHDHAHGGAMLPDVGTLVVASILLFAAGLVAYAKVRKD
jgi:uncharacterized membrane protein YkgB